MRLWKWVWIEKKSNYYRSVMKKIPEAKSVLLLFLFYFHTNASTFVYWFFSASNEPNPCFRLEIVIRLGWLDYIRSVWEWIVWNRPEKGCCRRIRREKMINAWFPLIRHPRTHAIHIGLKERFRWSWRCELWKYYLLMVRTWRCGLFVSEKSDVGEKK